MTAHLSQEFVDRYKTQTPPWGFNGLGEVVYLRTYSRRIEDMNRNETWLETVQRCVNGAIDIGTPLTKTQAEKLFDHVFNLRGSFSGRALWQLGTPLIKQFNAASLNNCYFVNIEKVEDFEFLFDHLMLGGGVGFSVERAKIHDLPKVLPNVKITHERSNDADIIVPDSRQGWRRLLHSVLKSYFDTGKSFSYSTILIREFGAPLKTFGGTASGPGALVDGIVDICQVMEAREGKKLRSIDVLDICNIIGRVVVSGSSRRSAQIAIGDPDDVLFLRAKNWASGDIPGYRANSNNSIYADYYDHIMPELWRGYTGGGEPYGLVNRRLARKYGRLKEERADKTIEGFNPCLTADTLIAVADGRGLVSIGELAKAGLDVPVYTFDQTTKRPVVRMMRNPHLTGTQVPIVKITLDSGDTITCTPDHKFITRDGSEIKAIDLAEGTSLRLLTRYQTAFNPGRPDKRAKQDYWHITSGSQTNKAEHRMIAEFINDCIVGQDEVVHHINHIGLDNRPENLKIMTVADHDAYHSVKMIGSDNPMVRGMSGEYGTEWIESYRISASSGSSAERNGRFSGASHSDIQRGALNLTSALGRKATHDEWAVYAKENGLPTTFSGWRRNALGSIGGVLNCAAHELGYPTGNTRIIKTLVNAWSQGYDAVLIDDVVHYNKICEICDSQFVTKQRQAGICSTACNMRRLANPDIRSKAKVTLRNINKSKHDVLRSAQADVWSNLKYALCRQPSKKEWIDTCRGYGISSEISRKSSPFRSYLDLAEAGLNSNHKVVSVESAGTADVYNGTVDEFHSYFIGGWETATKTGKPKQQFILSANCAEIGLGDGESCNLSTIFLPNICDIKQFKEISELLYMVQKQITRLAYPYAKTNAIVAKNARLGQSISGVLQASAEQVSWLDEAYRHLDEFDIYYSKGKGFPRSVRLTTVQPSGTLSLLPGITPGIHPAFAPFYIRRVRFGASDALVAGLRARGHKVVWDIGIDGREDHSRYVVEFPCKSPDNAVLAENMTAVEQLEWVKKMQTEWADNAVSVTVYYRKEELELIKEWLSKNYDTGVKSVSFLLHADHNFPLPPYEQISQADYDALVKKIDTSLPLSQATGSELSLDDCATGACPIR